MNMKQKNIWMKIRLPVCILIAFLVMAAWVGVGRLLFGVFGWMAFITLFMFAPIVVLYGTVLTIIVAIRQRKYRYRKYGPFMISLIVLLVLLFCVGFFMPDGGDTPESIGSAMSVVLMDRTNEIYIGIAGYVAGWAVFLTVLAAVATLVTAFIERPIKKVSASPVVG